MHNRNYDFLSSLLVGFVVVACGGKSPSTPGNGTLVTTGGSSGTGGASNADSDAVGGAVMTGGASNADSAAVGGAIATTGGTTPTATTGSSATGGAPNTGGTWTEPVSTVVGPRAVDVLLMVDNSASMTDKQKILAASVPRLIDRLVQPNCIDPTGAVVGKSQFGVCAQGVVEFGAVDNLHIGVISSSLGDHGGGRICTPGSPTSFTDSLGNVIVQPDDVNDKAHLVGTLARGVSALSSVVPTASAKIDAQGFLTWSSANQSPTVSDLTTAQGAFHEMVRAAGESGCGFESQLESWFRFLVDPVPPIMPITRDVNQMAQRVGSDDALLAQRAAFLRPNSTLAIVMLTDENDCSLRDTDVGWVATDTKRSISTGSDACADPNDKCCYSCTASPPVGCPSSCPNGAVIAQDDSAYQANLRCWQQKRRFGYEFMYPISRYVVGLTKPRLCPDQTFGDMDCDCTYAKSIDAPCSPGTRNLPNPLFSSIVGQDNAGNNVFALTNVAARKDASSVFLAGILGVPWQDVGSLDANGNLVYIPVTDPAWNQGTSGPGPVTAAPHGIWSNIYGDDNANVYPEDAHMVESLTPRPGLPLPDAAANADPISGHEWNTAYQDLEYACIFPLPESRACECSPADPDYASCKYQNPNDCCDLDFAVDGRGQVNSGGSFRKPLCNGKTQVAAKAYPSLREISVLRGYAQSSNTVGQNSIVTSICAKDLMSDPSSAGYGYNPAVDALVARMKERL